MMSEFPAYDPEADHGSADSGARKLSYPDLTAMAAADPYEVAAVILRHTFDPELPTSSPGDPVRSSEIYRGAEQALRDYSRGVFNTLTGTYPQGFERVVGRSIAIWRAALVAEILPVRVRDSVSQTILLEPDLVNRSDADLIARLRTRP